MRVLFSVQRAGFVKNFDSVVRLLAERGHDVLVSLAQPAAAIAGQQDLLDELAALPRVTVEHVLPLGPERTREIARRLRTTLDYFAVLDPRFPRSYRRAWEPRTPRPARLIGRWAPARHFFEPLLRAAESGTPPSAELTAYLHARNPDVLLLTPHTFPGSTQPDLLRAARALGIPSAVCIHSWDNLTSKGRIRLRPDRVLVWNEIQRREAEEFHGLPAELVGVTGAQAYDWWFERQPRPREEFCTRVGLDPAQPYVLYACSAPWTGRAETKFVLPWIEAIRAAGGPLAKAGILVRPHPKRDEAWPEVQARYGNVAVWPRQPELPGAAATRSEYFDSMFHSAALVGANTSAMIEAAILGKPVLTLSLPEFADEQAGTMHFRYLAETAGGLLTTAGTLGEHVEQLGQALDDPAGAARRAHAFTEVFVRPYGLDVPATPRFADEVERLAGLEPAPVSRRWAARGLMLGGAGAYIGARALWRGAKATRRGTGSPRPAEARPESAASGAPPHAPNEADRAAKRSEPSRARTGRAG